MTDLLPFLKELISAPGISGYESPIRKIIEDAWRPLTDELQVSRLGSLHGLRRGIASEPRPSLLLAAHMDAVGLMVASLVDGFLRLAQVGRLDSRVLPGQLITVHGRRDLPGVIAQPPSHLLPPDVKNGAVPLKYLLVDVGLLPRQVERLVRVGDPISFAQTPFEMGGDILAGHTLDDRAAVAAVTQCLKELLGRSLNWDLWVVATTQEEETFGGALTSAYQLRPTLAVAIDVTFAESPGSPAYRTFPLGKGLTLGWGPNIHPRLHQAFRDLADRLEIPYKLEAYPRHTDTDAFPMQVSAEGIPTMLIGIPLRYMHTPVEVVSLKDIIRTGRLLAEFASQLDEKFVEKQLNVSPEMKHED
jgi:putative aminopeptidase FrvX